MNRVSLKLVLCFLAALPSLAQEVGTLRMTVTDQDWDVPVNEATVYVLEMDTKKLTDSEGQAVFENLAPGIYSVSVSATGFERKILRGITVIAGQVQQESCVIAATYLDMDEFVVKDFDLSRAGSDIQLLDIRAQSFSLVDAVGADMMSKAGASTAAGALKMMAGTTVQDGKYAVIRGLGDRYTSTSINGVRLPNADRDKRAVSLDQFPAALIESIQVNKTFMPDQQGDATGGINIVTKGFPDKPIMQVSVSMESDSNATGNGQFKTYDFGGGNDFMGMRGLTRLDFWKSNDLRMGPRGGEEVRRTFMDDNDEEQTHISANKQYGTGVRANAPPANYGFKFAIGDFFEISDWKLGGLLLGSYSQKYKYRRGGQAALQTTPVESFDFPTGINRDNSRLTEASIDEQLWSAGVTLGAKNEHNNVRFTTLYTHQSRDIVELKYGPALRSSEEFPPSLMPTGDGEWGFDENWNWTYFPPYQYPVSQSMTDRYSRRWQTLMQYIENANASAQLAGDHTFSFLKDSVLDWGASFNMAESLEPDRREFGGMYLKTKSTQLANVAPDRTTPGSTPVWEVESEEESSSLGRPSGTRRWQEAREDSLQWQVNYKQPYALAEGWEGWFKGGYFTDTVERYYRNRIYGVTFNDDMKGCDEFELGRLSILNASSLGVPTQESIQYNGSQKIDAYYLMGRLPLPKWLDVVGGARVENTFLKTIVFNAPGVASATNNIRLYRKIDEGFIYRATQENDLDDAAVAALRDRFGAIAQQNTSRMTAGNALLEQTDVLPALMLNIKPWEELSLRLSYSETLARPIFKEITPILYPDVDSTRRFVGNPELKMSRLKNYDVRLEFRPDKTSVDLFAAGVFYKTIRDPIQYSTREGPAGSDMDFIMPENYGDAKIKGIEVEARKDFAFISEHLKGLSIGGNLTMQKSEVQYRSDMTNDLRRAQVKDLTRPMDGQADVLANANVIFDHDYTGLSLGVFYNWRGEMYISGDTATPSRYYPSIIERPIGSLDVTIGYKFKIGDSKYSPEWRLGLEFKNLLNPWQETAYRTPQKDLLRSYYSVGRTYGISLGCTW